MSLVKKIIFNLPEVAKPTQKRLSFREKLKWTGIILVLYYILGAIPLFGLGPQSLERFELFATILGASIGSLVSLGIGPIVTASIVLQLLNGSGIINFDQSSSDGRKTFQGVQKLLAVFFIIVESAIYVFMGGLAPSPDLLGTAAYFNVELMLIFQLFLGGMLILFMDEVVTKWGFGQGVSLFIAAGVSQQVFIRAFSFIRPENNPQSYAGAIPEFFRALYAVDPTTSIIMASGVIATIVVFVMAVYSQAMKVEIPLSFGRIRGQGIRWPLSFIYTSNIPVILVAALFANFQLLAQLLQSATEVCRETVTGGGVCSTGQNIMLWLSNLFGTFTGNTPASGLVSWITPQNIVEATITQGFVDGFLRLLPQSLIYIVLLTIGCVIFSWFWVQTSGMDAHSQAKQMMSSGLQIPGFRRDIRVLERLLQRYIGPLTILGAIAIGILAGVADISGALTNGTGLLLTVMIIYRLYEEIAKQHMMDMNPMMRKFMGGS